MYYFKRKTICFFFCVFFVFGKRGFKRNRLCMRSCRTMCPVTERRFGYCALISVVNSVYCTNRSWAARDFFFFFFKCLTQIFVKGEHPSVKRVWFWFSGCCFFFQGQIVFFELNRGLRWVPIVVNTGIFNDKRQELDMGNEKSQWHANFLVTLPGIISIVCYFEEKFATAETVLTKEIRYICK